VRPRGVLGLQIGLDGSLPDGQERRDGADTSPHPEIVVAVGERGRRQIEGDRRVSEDIAQMAPDVTYAGGHHLTGNAPPVHERDRAPLQREVGNPPAGEGSHLQMRGPRWGGLVGRSGGLYDCRCGKVDDIHLPIGIALDDEFGVTRDHLGDRNRAL
jgi:hypothetical protein